MKWMEQELRRVKSRNQLVALYSAGGDTDRFNAGYVLHVDSEHYVLSEVSSQGEWDGFLLRQLEGLTMIETGGRDLDRLAFLLADRNQTRPDNFLGELPKKDASMLQSVVTKCMRDKNIIMLGLDSREDLLAGYLVEQDNEVVRMQTVHHYFAEDDGQVAFPRQSIDLVEWGSRECRTIERLRRWSRVKKGAESDG